MDRVIGSRNKKAVPKTKKTFNQFKYEVADKTGMEIASDGCLREMMWEKLDYAENYMVKKMILLSREQLIGRK